MYFDRDPQDYRRVFIKSIIAFAVAVSLSYVSGLAIGFFFPYVSIIPVMGLSLLLSALVLMILFDYLSYYEDASGLKIFLKSLLYAWFSHLTAVYSVIGYAVSSLTDFEFERVDGQFRNLLLFIFGYFAALFLLSPFAMDATLLVVICVAIALFLYVLRNEDRFFEDDPTVYAWLILFLLAASFSAVPSTMQNIENPEEVQSPPEASYDNDQDLVNMSVNNSWIQMDTGEWLVDPSDTSNNSIKLEQDGKGLILQSPVSLPESLHGRAFYSYSSWDSVISSREARGFTHTSGPEVEMKDGRNFVVIGFSRNVSNSTAYADIIATVDDGQQYTFVYSYSPEFVDSQHREQILSRLTSATYKG